MFASTSSILTCLTLAISIAVLGIKADLQCSTPGQCVNSELVYEGNEKTRQDCHYKCKNEIDDCKWFSYRPDQNFCLLFANCNNITEAGCAETSCITGQKDCDLYRCGIQGSCLVKYISWLNESIFIFIWIGSAWPLWDGRFRDRMSQFVL